MLQESYQPLRNRQSAGLAPVQSISALPDLTPAAVQRARLAGALDVVPGCLRQIYHLLMDFIAYVDVQVVVTTDDHHSGRAPQ